VKRTKGLNQQSAKRRRENRERRRVMHDHYGPDPMCHARVEGVCTGRADDAHEPRLRAHGTDITDPEQAIPICRACHMWTHAHVAEAQARGLLVPSWDGAA